MIMHGKLAPPCFLIADDKDTSQVVDNYATNPNPNRFRPNSQPTPTQITNKLFQKTQHQARPEFCLISDHLLFALWPLVFHLWCSLTPFSSSLILLMVPYLDLSSLWRLWWLTFVEIKMIQTVDDNERHSWCQGDSEYDIIFTLLG